MKIGNTDISLIKLGNDDVVIYLGSTKIYPSDTPPTPTKQWVSYALGTSINTITDNVYGIRISIDNLTELFAGGLILDIGFHDFDIIIDNSNSLAYITDGTNETPIEYDFASDFEVIFSDYGFNDETMIYMNLDGSGDGTILCDMQLYM